MKKVSILLLLLVFLCSCKETTNQHDVFYQKAHHEYALGEYEKAYDLMLQSAEGGYPEAQCDLAWMYLNGVGVSQDVALAKKWYLKSADAGLSKAMTQLVSLQLDRTFGETDCEEVVRLLDAAHQLNDLSALKIFAGIYEKGICVEESEGASTDYYDKLIKDKRLSDFTLGTMYFWGDGVDKDYQKAVSLMINDLDGNKYLGGYVLGIAYDDGLGVGVDKVISHKYFLMSANLGNTSAQYNVGINLYNGYGVKQNKEDALRWIEKAAKKNNLRALTFIGYMYETGTIYEKNIERAKEHYSKASGLGWKRAQQQLDSLQ